MDNVLIDDRRIHVDFSQSVAKIKWKGKGTESFVVCIFGMFLFLYWRLCQSKPSFYTECYCHPRHLESTLTLSFISRDLTRGLVCFPGGKYTKDDFKAYEKDVESRSKLALKDQVKPKQEYPCVLIGCDFIFQFSPLHVITYQSAVFNLTASAVVSISLSFSQFDLAKLSALTFSTFWRFP